MVDTQKDSNRELAKNLGALISKRRKALSWTQAQLADRMGCDAETISRFERGVNLPSLSTLLGMSEALCCRVSELLGEERERTVPLGYAEMISVWMSELADEERQFVVNQIQSLCSFFVDCRARADVKSQQILSATLPTEIAGDPAV